MTGNADNLREAGRKLEDANTPNRADSTLEIYQMELERLKKEIEKYREIYREDGKVVSDMTLQNPAASSDWIDTFHNPFPIKPVYLLPPSVG